MLEGLRPFQSAFRENESIRRIQPSWCGCNGTCRAGARPEPSISCRSRAGVGVVWLGDVRYWMNCGRLRPCSTGTFVGGRRPADSRAQFVDSWSVRVGVACRFAAVQNGALSPSRWPACVACRAAPSVVAGVRGSCGGAPAEGDRSFGARGAPFTLQKTGCGPPVPCRSVGRCGAAFVLRGPRQVSPM